MSRIIGIDLGTTNSCVAVLDDKGTPKTLAGADGELGLRAEDHALAVGVVGADQLPRADTVEHQPRRRVAERGVDPVDGLRCPLEVAGARMTAISLLQRYTTNLCETGGVPLYWPPWPNERQRQRRMKPCTIRVKPRPRP